MARFVHFFIRIAVVELDLQPHTATFAQTRKDLVQLRRAIGTIAGHGPRDDDAGIDWFGRRDWSAHPRR